MLYGLLGGILWALDTVILSMALAPFDLIWLAPAVATFLHDTFSALYLWLLMLIREDTKAMKALFRRRQSLWLVAAGLLGGPIGMCGYVFAIGTLGPGLTAVLSCLYPALGALCARLFLHDSFSMRQGIGLLISLLGVGLLSWGGTGTIPNLPLGLFWVSLCILGWGLEGVVAQKGMKDELVSSQEALTIRQSTSALVFGLVLMPLLNGWPLCLEIAASFSIWYLAGAALAGTLSYLNYYKAIHLIGAAKAQPLNITYAAWALVFAFVFQGAVPGLFQIVCAIMIVGGAIYSAS